MITELRKIVNLPSFVQILVHSFILVCTYEKCSEPLERNIAKREQKQ